MIRLYVADRLERSTGDVRLEFDVRDRELLALGDEKYQFRLVSATNHVSAGSTGLRVEVYDRASPRLVVRSAHVKFEVVLLDDVVVAARAVRAGRMITEQDLRVERREFRETPRMLLHEAADIAGATAKRNIEVGQMLRLDDMQKTLMVERGNAVTVVLHGRGFRIKTTCRVLESGELGSAVAVQGVDGRGKFYATVIGPRTVEVRLAGAPAPEEAPAGESEGRLSEAPTGEVAAVADATATAPQAAANQGDR
jgi:flagella basal body P-ring formation protein FlgA